MPIDWEHIRKTEFPALENLTYLAVAGASPMSKSAYDKGIEYFKEMLNYGDLNHNLFFLELDTARELVAEYINAEPENIAFMINTSSGMNTVAHIFKKEKGEILYPFLEFPASVHMFMRMGYPCKKVQGSDYKVLIEDFERELTDKTKFIVHSHTQSFNGFRQNLDKLGAFCEENNLINIINATQSFGSFEIDVKKQNIDVLVSAALKNIGCGYGTGILYVNGDIIGDSEERLPFTSWLSVDDPFSMDNENLRIIKKMRSMDSMGGCPNFASLLTLIGAFNLIKNKIGNGSIQAGVKAIQERVIWLNSEFINKIEKFNFKILTPLELEYRSGIITVEHPKAKRIHRHLLKNNIYITLKRYPNLIKETLLRFALNYYNNLEDIDQTISILKGFSGI